MTTRIINIRFLFIIAILLLLLSSCDSTPPRPSTTTSPGSTSPLPTAVATVFANIKANASCYTNNSGKIALTYNEGGDKSGIYLYDISAQRPQPLVIGEGHYGDLAWSSDFKNLAYIKDGDLYIIAIDEGSKPKQLGQGIGEDKSLPSWTDNNKFVVYYRAKPKALETDKTAYEMWRIKITDAAPELVKNDLKKPTQVTWAKIQGNSVVHPQNISGTENILLYVRYFDDIEYGIIHIIYLRDKRNSKDEFPSDSMYSIDTQKGIKASQAALSPDGKTIAYIMGGKLQFVRFSGVIDDPIKGEYESVLPFSPITWSGDSEHISFRLAGEETLETMKVDGTDKCPLYTVSRGEARPSIAGIYADAN